MGMSRRGESHGGGSTHEAGKGQPPGPGDVLLRTKLQRPPVAPDILPRARLLDRLNEGQQPPLTLISAPAGYGKHTLGSCWLVLVAVVLILALQARAELPYPEQGLLVQSWKSGGEATATARTPDGYWWLATGAGLQRFDGARFVTFTTETTPALGANAIRSLLVDGQGALWVGTAGGTLSCRRGNEFFPVPLDERLRGVPIESMTPADDGGLWIQAGNLGLVQVSKEGRILSSFADGLPPTRVSPMLRLSNGQWWATAPDSPDGLRMLVGDTWQPRRFGVEPGTRYWSLAADQQGTGLWLGTAVGPVDPTLIPRGARIFKVQDDEVLRELAPYPWRQDSVYARIGAMAEDGQGRLWVANGHGVYYWQSELGWRELLTKDQRPFLGIMGFHTDAEGSLWMFPLLREIHRVTEQPVATVSLPEEHGRQTMQALCITRSGDLWVGTEDDGVFRFQGGRFVRVDNGLGSLNILTLFEDSRANLWAGTREGLYRWNGDRFEAVSLGNDVHSILAICEDRRGDVWVGNQSEVVQFSPEGQFRRFVKELETGQIGVLSLTEDTNGRIYASVHTFGLFQLNGDKFERFPANFGPELNRAMYLLPDEDSGLWVTAWGHGLYRFGNGTFRSWTTDDGLPTNRLTSIIADGADNLWFSSPSGIFGCPKKALLDYQSGKSPPIVFWRFGEEDGLGPDYYPYLGQDAARSADGRLWFTYRDVVAVINPALVSRPQVEARPIIEDVVADGVVYPWRADGELRLPSGTRQLEVHYTCPSLWSPEKLWFRRMLEGLDDDWVDVGMDRAAHYAKLKPGNYHFRVMASTRSGGWIECELSLALTVVPRWWERVYVRLLGAFALAGVLMGAVWRVTVVRHRRRTEKLEQQLAREAERREAEKKAQQLRAFRDMGREVMLILSEPGSFLDAMPPVLQAVKTSTGVDAVGIRLLDEDDFPYFYQEGFSDDFLRKENSLLRRDRDGGICRDANGQVSLECTCGLVISGKTNPANPLFTRGGSAWTNDSAQLLDLPAHEDPRDNPRNECIHQGYASVALIPIRAKGRIIGLLHLNGRKKGCFTLEAIEALESAAENIGEAMLRKQIELALTESEAKHRTVVEQATEGIVILQDEQRKYANPAWLAITGYTSEEYPQLPFLHMVHPDDLEIVKRQHDRITAGEEFETNLIFRIIAKSDLVKWVISRSTVIEWEGRPAILVLLEDVTERKLAEVALRESERQLKEAQRIAQIGSWELDLVTSKLRWSDEIFRIFEIDKEHFGASYEYFLSMIHPDDREAVDIAYTQSVEAQTPYLMTHRLLMPDGRVKFVQERCETFYSPEGKPLRSIGTVQDITARKEAEEAVKDAERRYRTVAEFTYDWEYWVGAKNEILYMAPSCERLSGYSPGEFAAHPRLLEEIVVPEDRDMWVAHEHGPQIGGLREIQFRIKRKDGSTRWIEHACRPVFDRDGTFDGFRVSNRDITVRKASEEALQRSQSSLQRLAGRLISAQEEDRRRLARDLHDDVTQRLALLAIDIGMLGSKSEDGASPLQEELGAVQKNIIRLSKDIHDISRQIHPAILEDLGLTDALKSECIQFREREGIEVECQVDPGLAPVPNDVAICLYRITQEGLRNIARHSKAHKAFVSLASLDGSLILTVRDYGLGFTVSDAGGHRGIGVASMQERARLVGGEFSMQSKPGEGTTIRVCVPAARIPE